MPNNVAIESIRPLVRYVDEEQAVIDAHVTVKPRVPTRALPPAPQILDLFVEIDSEEGFHDEQQVSINLNDLSGAFRIELVQPKRWWPAGMGDQMLYELKVSLMMGNNVIDQKSKPIGLTSVRCSKLTDATAHTGAQTGSRKTLIDPADFLVNGRVFNIDTVLQVDRVDESAILPVGGDTLVIVRDHYGPDILYEAADRAGILIVQCVPIDPQGHPEEIVIEQITRLAAHPCLAGWCVGHQGEISQAIAKHIASLDPTHAVFTAIPKQWAA